MLKDLNACLAGGVQGGAEIAEFYTEITNKLGFEQSYVAGASVGGFIATNYALHKPERVKKLVLLGSMGYGTTIKTITGIMLAQFFPLKPIQDLTFEWAFGDNLKVKEYFEDWFRLVLDGTMPKPPRPATFTPKQLQGIQVPTLALFGTRDGVVGDVEQAKTLALNMPEVQIEIVESGHLIGAELSEHVNSMMIEFFQKSD